MSRSSPRESLPNPGRNYWPLAAFRARSTDQFVILLLGLAAILRVATILVLRSYSTIETAYEHHMIATSLLTGRGFSFPFFGPSGPTSQQAPFVPLVLAACYALFGIGRPFALLVFQMFATAASVATVFAVSEIARQIGGERPRLFAGLGCAVYPAFVISVTHVQAAPFAMAWLVLMVRSGLRATDDPCPSHAIRLGLWSGLGALTDPILLIPAAIILAYLGAIWRPMMGWVGVARRVGLTCSILVLAVTPWTIRNWVVHHRLILIKDSFWYVLWQGNGPEASGTDKLILVTPSPEEGPEPPIWNVVGRYRKLLDERRRSISVNAVLPDEFVARLGRMPTEIERMDAFGVLIRDVIRENPGHYLRMCLRRLRYFVTFDPTNPKSSHPLYRLCYVGAVAFGLAGACVMGSEWRRLALVYGAMIGIALPSIFIITSARFRLPAEVFLIILAALGVSGMVSGLRDRDDIRSAP